MVNEPDRAELEGIKQSLDRLRNEANLLADRVGRLEQRWRVTSTAPAQPESVVRPEITRPVPPPLPATGIGQPPSPPPCAPRHAAGRLPEVAPQAAVVPVPSLALEPAAPTRPALNPAEAASGDLGVSASEGLASETSKSLEMRMGTYWFVRLGVVMVLTAVVFFGKYAYTNFIGNLGALGKVTLMYLAGGVLTVLGAWLQRGRYRESLRNYGQVLFAGGLATVYFTTYAAPHVERLRVISSPVVDGILLLAWAGFIVWLADRRKSELMAVLAVGLAFYASAITQVGVFTLFSNLVLTVVTVAFLFRHRWIALPSVGLAAAYAGYAFWRFHSPEGWNYAGPSDGLWMGAMFLGSYWAIFTTAVFMPREDAMSMRHRVALLTANNATFFTLFVLTMAQVNVGGFWTFCFVYGGALLTAALAAQRTFPDQRWVGISYLLQGLTLVTVGLIAKFSGPRLGLILATESVLLLMAGHTLSLTTVRRSALAIAGLAAFFTVAGLLGQSRSDLALGLGVGGLLIFEAWWTGARQTVTSDLKLRAAPAYLTVLALVVWLATVVIELDGPVRLPALAASGLVLTLSYYWLRLPELTLLAQAYPLLALVGCSARALSHLQAEPAWSSLSIVACGLALAHWWQHQRILDALLSLRRAFETTFAALTMIGLLLWLEPRFTRESWLALSGLIALAAAFYGWITRSGSLAGAGQVFALAAVWQFAQSLEWPASPRIAALVPGLSLALLAVAARLWLRKAESLPAGPRESVTAVASIYGWTALGMSVLWMHRHIPAREHVWILAAMAALSFALAGWKQYRQAFVASGLLSFIAVVQFLVPLRGASTLYVLNLALPLLAAAQQRAVRRWPQSFDRVLTWQTAWMLIASLGAGWYLTLLVQEHAKGFYLTAAWAIYAMATLVIGLAWRERVYRWTGLAILGLALGRVLLVDVWTLDALYRTLSFLALGLVLLALGYIYNQYQDKIRQWL